MSEESKIQFVERSSDEPVLVLKANGDILWRGRLVTNDQELVDGLRDLLNHRLIVKNGGASIVSNSVKGDGE